MQRLDGLAFGEDPRQGYFAGDVLYHPALRFQMTLPAGWKHQNSRAAVASQEPDQKAMIQLSLADAGTLSPGAFASGSWPAARSPRCAGGAETIGGFPAWVGRLSIPQEGAAPAVMTAGWIRRADTLMFQVLGHSQQPGDADEARILASLRSIRALSDAARLDVTCDRVKVEKVGDDRHAAGDPAEAGRAGGRVRDGRAAEQARAGRDRARGHGAQAGGGGEALTPAGGAG